MEFKLQKESSYHKDGILSCCVKNNFLATASEDDSAVIWSLPDLNPIRQSKLHDKDIKKIIFSPCGKYLITASADGEIKSSAFSDFSVKTAIKEHSSAVNEICFISDKNFLSVSDDSTAKLWELGNKSCLKTLKPGIGDIKACAAGQGKVLIGGSSLVFLDSNLSTLKKHSDYLYGINKIKVNENKAFVSASMEKTLEIWDLNSMNILKKIRNSSWINEICFYKDKIILAMGEYLKVLNENFETEIEIEAHSDEIYALDIYEDFLISGANDKLLKIWKIN
ncbi:MAG: hypothetical protein AB1637_08285 [Elusimicrobiota bacterium]